MALPQSAARRRPRHVARRPRLVDPAPTRLIADAATSSCVRSSTEARVRRAARTCSRPSDVLAVDHGSGCWSSPTSTMAGDCARRRVQAHAAASGRPSPCRRAGGVTAASGVRGRPPARRSTNWLVWPASRWPTCARSCGPSCSCGSACRWLVRTAAGRRAEARLEPLYGARSGRSTPRPDARFDRFTRRWPCERFGVPVATHHARRPRSTVVQVPGRDRVPRVALVTSRSAPTRSSGPTSCRCPTPRSTIASPTARWSPGRPRLRFYAGAPLDFDGHRVGTLCIADQRPRLLDATDLRELCDLASLVVAAFHDSRVALRRGALDDQHVRCCGCEQVRAGGCALRARSRSVPRLRSPGVSHLTFQREEFRAQVPPWVPLDADLVVLASGVVEIALGGALLSTWVQPRRATLGAVVAGFLHRRLPGQHRPMGGDPTRSASTATRNASCGCCSSLCSWCGPWRRLTRSGF